MRLGNDALYERNHDLNLEIEELNKHSEVLIAQNKELQSELENFVITDDIVRRNLDRKDKVGTIRKQVDEVLKKSN